MTCTILAGAWCKFEKFDMDTSAARRGCSGAKSWGVAALPIKIKHSLKINFVSLQGQECRYFTARYCKHFNVSLIGSTSLIAGSWHMRFVDAVAWAQRHPKQDSST